MKTTQLAHEAWARFLRPGATVIDATCGNGHDTLVLARLLQGKGRLLAYDIQEKAIEATRGLLISSLSEKERSIVSVIHASHENFSLECADLVVYNLGFLPGSDKTIKTEASTTMRSLHSALSLLSEEGVISLTCYPGHPEGAEEEKALLAFLTTLPPDQWDVHYQTWLNRHKAPSLLLVRKRRASSHLVSP